MKTMGLNGDPVDGYSAQVVSGQPRIHRGETQYLSSIPILEASFDILPEVRQAAQSQSALSGF